MPFTPIDGSAGLTHARLREALHYDPEAGLFTWLIPRSRAGGVRGIGKMAGRISRAGYIRLAIDTVRYRAHRLAWFYMSGEWPSKQIDHINGVRCDNRFANLRLATQSQNSANMMRKRREPLAKGVVRYQNTATGTVRYRAHIMVSRRAIYLGSFATENDASDAYRSAAREHFGEFARAA